jgi:hypothetical protein
MTTNETTARALIDSAAAALGWTTAGPRRAYQDDPEPGPMPATVTDPATGRAIHVRRITYPAAQAGRLAISPTYPADPVTGRTTHPRTPHPVATVSGDTPPATLARRLRRYVDESAESYAEAVAAQDSAARYEEQTAATMAALVAAGWRPGSKHDATPRAPELPGRAYAIAESVTGDTVRLTLAGLSAEQAVAALAAIASAP